MKRMIRYKLKPGAAAENEQLIRAVFAELRALAPPGLRYASFRLDDGLSFVHLVSHEAAEGDSPLAALPAFKAFVAGIRARCDEAPMTVELNEIGSHGFFTH